MANRILIDFTGPAVDFDGRPMKVQGLESTWADVLRKIVLGESTSGDRRKLYGWCTNLIEEGKLELDKSDFDVLKTITEECRRELMVVGPLIEIMMKAKDESEKPKPSAEETA